MSGVDTSLNLARALRPKTFGEVKGQELSIRLLQNSLYKGIVFPVYLFAGLRGSGKTTSARIFAAALNCERLADFQKNPQTVSVPCLSCASCYHMARGSHPDFLEVDAASYTGVDTIRSIIEAAACAPVLGRVRIYLIDEAHMLSKAAFNALLKMLEEPPAHVHFLLATTDPHKILDTVRSRSFQVFFNPIERETLVTLLEEACSANSISYEREALVRIAVDAEGSARDALNALERLRLACQSITVAELEQVIGVSSHAQWTPFIEALVGTDIGAVCMAVPALTEARASVRAYTTVLEYAHELLHAVATKSEPTAYWVDDEVRRVAKLYTVTDVLHLMRVLYEYDQQLHATTTPHTLWQFIGCEVYQRRIHVPQQAPRSGPRTQQSTSTAVPSSRTPSAPRVVPQIGIDVKSEPVQRDVSVQSEARTDALAGLASLDAVIHSLCMQARLDVIEGVLHVTWPKRFQFYSDMLESKKSLWHSYLCKAYGVQTVTVRFDEQVTVSPSPRPVAREVSIPSAAPVAKARETVQRGYQPASYKHTQEKREQRAPELDVSDAQRWVRTHEVLQVFPGIVRKVVE